MSSNNQFHILILEDNEYYNNLVTHQVKRHALDFALAWGVGVAVQSYTSSKDCLRNAHPDIDIAFMDYYLNDGYTGAFIQRQLLRASPDCKLAVISHFRSVKTSLIPLSTGAMAFIKKDQYAMERIKCFMEDKLMDKICGLDFPNPIN